MKDVTLKLKSQSAVVSVLVLALLAQMPHAQYVFYTNGHEKNWFGWLQSWGGAIAFEVAVLVFAIRGNTKVSWGFAAFSVAVNLIYYYDSTVAWYVPRASWLLSAGLPVAIALYSHEVADRHESPAQPVAQPAKPKAKSLVAQTTIEPLPVVAPVADTVEPVMELAQPADGVEMQPVAIMPALQAQLDELDTKILNAVGNGSYTPYAISKATGAALTTLKRKQGDKVTGRLPKLVAAGFIRNSSGDDGSEYRLVEG
jgi:hypothetical protein